MRWSDVLALVLTNLSLRPSGFDGDGVGNAMSLSNVKRREFSINKHIIPFLKANHELFFLSGGRGVHDIDPDNLWATIETTLKNNPDKFVERANAFWALTEQFAPENYIYYSPGCKAAAAVTASLPLPSNLEDESLRTEPSPSLPSHKVPLGACRKGTPLSPVKADGKFIDSLRKNDNVNPTSIVEHRPSSREKRERIDSGAPSLGINSSTNHLRSKNLSSSMSSLKIRLSKVASKDDQHRRRSANNIPASTTAAAVVNNTLSTTTIARSVISSSKVTKSKPKNKTKVKNNNKNVVKEMPLVDLDSVIPMPENFEGPNNPFYLIQSPSSGISKTKNSNQKSPSSTTSSSCSSGSLAPLRKRRPSSTFEAPHSVGTNGGEKSSNKPEYRIWIKQPNTDSPKLVLSRVVNSSNSSSYSLVTTATTAASVTAQSQPPSATVTSTTAAAVVTGLSLANENQNSNLENQTHFSLSRPNFHPKILAQRITPQGVEYMIEQEHRSDSSPFKATDGREEV